MAFSTPAKPVKRRTATYGRPSARKSFGFETPDEDELAQAGPESTSAGLPEVQQHQRKESHPSSRTPSRVVDRKVSLSQQSPKNLPTQTSISDLDAYDVPSSDNEDPLSITPKHPAKKRKLPQKPPTRPLPSAAKNNRKGESIVAKAKTTDSKGKNFSIRNKKESEDLEQSSNSNLPSVATLAAPRSVNKIQAPPTSFAHPSLSPAWTPSKTYGKDEAGSTSSHGSSPKRKRFHSASMDDSDGETSVPSSTPRLNVGIHRKLGGPTPVTPPRSETRRHAETPPSAKLATDITTQFMSPSNLEMPKLSIEGSASSATPRALIQSPREVNLLSTTPGRSKLKDRLTLRDGSARLTGRDTEVESEESDEDASQMTQRPQIATQLSSQDGMTWSSQGKTPADIPKISLVAGPHQTYSAKRRTFRRDENEDDMLTGLGLENDDEIAQTTRRIRTEPVVHATTVEENDLDFPEDDDGTSSKLKNIHELREAGANAKLTGETEAILEEMESSNKSTARWGLLNLALKLEVKTFRNSLIGAGLEHRVFSKLGTEHDRLSRHLLAMSVAQLLVESIPRQTLEQNLGDLIALSHSLMQETSPFSSIARDRSLNVAKGLQQELIRLSKIYTKSAMWSQGHPPNLTGQLISIQLLERLTRSLRGSGFRGQVLQTSMIEGLMGLLSGCEPALIKESDGLNDEYLTLKLVLSLLESSSIIHASSKMGASISWNTTHLYDLAKILASIPRWSTAHQNDTLSLLLRLCLNITNGNTNASDPFSQAKVIGAISIFIRRSFNELASDVGGDDQALQVDNLILALGFLINLAEISQRSQERFLEPFENEQAPLQILLELFASRWLQAFEATSEHESRINVPMGYLTALLTLLCAHHSIRRTVAERLEGGSLRHLLVAAEAFLIYNKKVTEDIHDTEDNSDLKAHFLDRLESLINELKLELPHGH